MCIWLKFKVILRSEWIVNRAPSCTVLSVILRLVVVCAFKVYNMLNKNETQSAPRGIPSCMRFI